MIPHVTVGGESMELECFKARVWNKLANPIPEIDRSTTVKRAAPYGQFAEGREWRWRRDCITRSPGCAMVIGPGILRIQRAQVEEIGQDSRHRSGRRAFQTEIFQLRELRQH